MVLDMQMPLTCNEDPDQVLIQSLVQGDGEALMVLMRRHGRWVRGVLFGVLGRAEDVEDVEQQVWLSFWQRCAELDDTSRWRNWLYRMARNAAIDSVRRSTRRRKLWHGLKELFGRQGRPQPRPDRRAIVQEEHQRVLTAIGRIPQIYREAFVLRHLEGLSYQQIAELIGVAPETVGTRLVRARRHLLQILRADGNDD